MALQVETDAEVEPSTTTWNVLNNPTAPSSATKPRATSSSSWADSAVSPDSMTSGRQPSPSREEPASAYSVAAASSVDPSEP